MYLRDVEVSALAEGLKRILVGVKGDKSVLHCCEGFGGMDWVLGQVDEIEESTKAFDDAAGLTLGEGEANGQAEDELGYLAVFLASDAREATDTLEEKSDFVILRQSSTAGVDLGST